MKITEAERNIGKIQDLGENVAAIKAAVTTTCCAIKCRTVAEVSGKDPLSGAAIHRINKALAEASPKLQLQ